MHPLGVLSTQTLDDVYVLIEVIATNNYQAPSQKVITEKGVMKCNTRNTILAQNAILSQKIVSLTKQIREM